MNTKPDINDRTSDVLNNIQFSDVLNIEDIQRIQDLFSDATGVASIITDPDGTPITKPSNFCRLCKNIIRTTEKGCANCIKSDAVLGRFSPSGPFIQPCLSGGLWDAGASISVGGKHIANWLIGQVRDEELDIPRMSKYADEIGANREKFLEALHEVPVMSVEQLNKVSKMLFAFANELSEKAYYNLQLKMQITEQQKATVALRESEERYRLLIETAKEGIVVTQGDKLKFVNPMMLELTGYTEEELFSLPFLEIVHQDDREIVRSNYLKRQKGEAVVPRYHFRILKRDKSIKWVEISGVKIEWKGQPAIQSFVTDITDRKQAEIELHEKEVQYRNLADGGLALIWATGTDKLCNYFNEPWLKFTGRTLDQEFGNGWTEGIHPMDYDHCLQTYITAFDKHETFNMEYRLHHVSGEYRWILDRGTPNYNINGEFIGYIGNCFDISELKQAEAEINLKNEQLLKLIVEKDKFFSIIAHDLRNPLTSFLGLTQLMTEKLPKFTMDKMQQIAISMRNSASNLFGLLENLLHWASIQQGLIPFNPKVVRLLPFLEESMVIFLDPAKNKKITITYAIPDDLLVFADSNILQTIIRNLVSNALKFTPQGGKISLSARATGDNCAEISIKDSGIGMNSAMIDNLFRLDVKTNRNGTEGELSTGLGLLLCKEFIGKHGGKLWVESEEGKGSTFYFTIPYNAEPVNAEPIK